jgi:hypothetical protein
MSIDENESGARDATHGAAPGIEFAVTGRVQKGQKGKP